MKKFYIEFDYPGALFAETQTKPYDGTTIVWPEFAYAYKIGYREEIVQEKETLVGNMTWGKRVLRGKIYSLEQIKEKFPEAKILIENMEINGWDNVVRCPSGNFQPILDGETVVEG